MLISQCLNPDCLNQNPSDTNFCHKCGNKLLLGDRYRAQKIIGQGGFGRTFLAVDEYKPSKPPCVIKQFYPQAQGTSSIQKATELFELEAVRLEQLGKHPQIPDLLAYLSQDGRQYLVQEFMDGENLAQALKSEGYFSETQIRDLLKNLLPVFEFIHSRQVIHRDIKLENIILRSNRELVLVDFGAAKYATQTALAVTGTMIGSAGYTAPEQAAGKAIYASDIYSLGVTCLCLLTQVEPLELFDVSEFEWVWREHLKTSVSSELGQILDKMIQPASKKRYQSATEVLQALGNQSPQLSPQLSPQPSPQSSPQPSPDLLKSARGVDYTCLRDLLAAGKWQEADGETQRQITGNGEKYFRCENYDAMRLMLDLPCTDLHTIDRLWLKYSKGRFGFSVQKSIWERVDANIVDFAHSLGWVNGNDALCYEDVNFTLGAPVGHLPCFKGGFYTSGDSLCLSYGDRPKNKTYIFLVDFGRNSAAFEHLFIHDGLPHPFATLKARQERLSNENNIRDNYSSFWDNRQEQILFLDKFFQKLENCGL
jgi:serine/threonine protein kinase